MPGLDAKDVIDIQITVEHLGVADDLAEDLAAAGFPRIEHIVADDPKPSYLGGETDPAVWAKRIHGSADPGAARTSTFGWMVGRVSSSRSSSVTGFAPTQRRVPNMPNSRSRQPRVPPASTTTPLRSMPTWESRRVVRRRFPPGMGVGREIRLVPLTTQRHVTGMPTEVSQASRS